VIPAAAALLASATITGALGAHLLVGHWSAGRLRIYDTAVRYQFYHSLGLLGVGVLLRGKLPEELTTARRLALQKCLNAARALFIGIVLFCGSLYALSLGAAPWVGVVTPFGGGLLIVGWLVFAYGAWNS
jgi:uncharacterized membrane protein YgdD (TMEM256/DUF423 family)